MTTVATLIGYICILLSILFYYKKSNLIKAIILAIITYFMEYVIISGGFFWIDYFNVFRAVIVLLIVNILLVTYLFIKNKKFEVCYEYKQYIIPFLIVCCILPITINKFELHGMGQDEGVYQIKAIALMTGNTKKQLDFNEYDKLKDENEKSLYEYVVKSRFVGFDNYDNRKPTLNESKELSAVSGIFHGIPTFPAILALWGLIFGMSNMLGVQTLFLIVTIFMIWFVGENLKLKLSSNILATIIFSASPIVLWVSKSSLSEMFLTTIIATMIYFWTYEDDNNSIYFSTFCLITFSFYHVTIYTIMPLIVLIHIIMYLWQKKIKYIYAGIISVIGFAIGYTMMIFVSPTYTTNNTRIPVEQIFPWITDSMLLLMVYLGCVSAIVIFIIVYKYNNSKFLKSLRNIKLWSKITIVILVLMGIKILLVGISHAEKNQSILLTFKNLNIMAYTWGSGVIIVPILLILIFIRSPKLLSNKNICILFVSFLYCVIFYSSVLRTTVPYYYYYSRYNVPYIPIITLLAAYMMNNLDKIKIYIMCLLSICLYIPFNYNLSIGLDDSRMEWSVLEDIVSHVKKDDIIFIEDGSSEIRNIVQTLALPIKYITGAEIYPASEKNEQQLIDSTTENGHNIFYITDKDIDDTTYEIQYKNTVNTSDDYQEFHNKDIIPYPYKFSANSYDIYLYQYEVKNVYNFETDNENIKTQGFGPLESNFLWSYQQEASVWCNIVKKDYTLKVKLGPGMLIDNELSLVINNNYIQKTFISKGKGNIELEYEIPKEYLNNGENKITFSSNLWSPSDYGTNDKRMLGFSLVQLAFEEKK